MKRILLLLAIFILACKKEGQEEIKATYKEQVIKLTLAEANNLVKLPLKCVQQEYPNKLGQVIGAKEDLQTPSTLHPAFYGCFDWHSAVHGHWSMVKLLKEFPSLEQEKFIREKLIANLSKENILVEVAYFQGKYNTIYERTYGWAWLLKLAEELHTWNDPLARDLVSNLKPLTDLIVQKYIHFLPKLNYPIRVGEHANTAFGLAFAWDYANTVNNLELKTIVEKRAKDFYLNDSNCPITWEPSGYDFLSPCLEEAEIMARVLSEVEFKKWIVQFLPELAAPNFSLKVGEVSDRTDGKLVHLDGVNFSRAWALLTIAKKAKEYAHLYNIANEHIQYSLPNIIEDDYEGGHWLGSFAIYALHSY